MLLAGADRLPCGIELRQLPVSGGDLGAVYELIAAGDHEQQRRELGGGRAAEFMVDINRGFVADPRQREAFGAALRLLCSPGRLPLLYHCSRREGPGRVDDRDRAHRPRACRASWCCGTTCCPTTSTAPGTPSSASTWSRPGSCGIPELLRPILEQSATYLGAAFEEAERDVRVVRPVPFRRAGDRRGDAQASCGVRSWASGCRRRRLYLASAFRRRGPRLCSRIQVISENSTASADQRAHVSQPVRCRLVRRSGSTKWFSVGYEGVEADGARRRAETPAGRRR